MTSPQLHATLKLRTFPPHGITDVRHRVFTRLHRLADAGTLASVDVDVWGGYAVTDSLRDQDDAAALVPEFERWAEERGYSLAPAFDRRERGSMLDDGTWEVWVVPLVTLVVREEDRLKAVYPHANGERIRTVDDGLEALEARNPPGDGRSDESTDEPDGAERRRERLLVAPGR